MAKDRLGDLLKSQKKNHKDVAVEIENGVNEPQTASLKKTFERAEVLRQWLETIEINVSAIRQYISKLNDITVKQRDLNDKIESLFQNNTSICQKINGKLKEVEQELETVNPESAEGRIKTIQYNTLKMRYTKVFRDNNDELENYRNVQKAHLEAQLRAKGVRVSDEELVALLEEKADIQLFTDNIIAETAEAKRVLADIEERHQQLLKIERMLVEVRDLFLQMAILVDTQQDLIDRVEYQAGEARNFVGKAPKILSAAAKKKRKYFKCRIYMSIVIAILIIVFFLLLLK